MHAPFAAIAVTIPLFIKSIINGETPTLMGWAPIPTTTGLWCLLASTTDRTTAFRSDAARKEGRPSINVLNDAPRAWGDAESSISTLLFLEDKGYVFIFLSEICLYVFIPYVPFVLPNS